MGAWIIYCCRGKLVTSITNAKNSISTCAPIHCQMVPSCQNMGCHCFFDAPGDKYIGTKVGLILLAPSFIIDSRNALQLLNFWMSKFLPLDLKVSLMQESDGWRSIISKVSMMPLLSLTETYIRRSTNYHTSYLILLVLRKTEKIRFVYWFFIHLWWQKQEHASRVCNLK